MPCNVCVGSAQHGLPRAALSAACPHPSHARPHPTQRTHRNAASKPPQTGWRQALRSPAALCQTLQKLKWAGRERAGKGHTGDWGGASKVQHCWPAFTRGRWLSLLLPISTRGLTSHVHPPHPLYLPTPGGRAPATPGAAARRPPLPAWGSGEPTLRTPAWQGGRAGSKGTKLSKGKGLEKGLGWGQCSSVQQCTAVYYSSVLQVQQSTAHPLRCCLWSRGTSAGSQGVKRSVGAAAEATREGGSRCCMRSRPRPFHGSSAPCRVPGPRRACAAWARLRLPAPGPVWKMWQGEDVVHERSPKRGEQLAAPLRRNVPAAGAAWRPAATSSSLIRPLKFTFTHPCP